MEVIIEELERELLRLKGTKISQKEVSEVVSALKVLYNGTNNADQLAEYLMKFPLDVCRVFFQDIIHVPESYLNDVVTALKNNDLFKSNRGDFSLFRGFCIVALYMKTGELPEVIASLLARLLEMSEREAGFSKNSINIFAKRVREGYDLSFVLNPTITSWNKSERERYKSFIKAAIDTGVMDVSVPEVKDWLERNLSDAKRNEESLASLVETEAAAQDEQLLVSDSGRGSEGEALISGEQLRADVVEKIEEDSGASFDKSEYSCPNEVGAREGGFLGSELPDVIQRKNELSAGDKIDEKQKLSDDLLKTLKAAHREAMSLSSELAGKYGTITSLKQELITKDKEISALRADIAELNNLLNQKEHLVDEQRAKIDDLDGRLESFFKLDESSRSQSLITLKKEIARALRLEYRDFCEDKDAPCDRDIFEAYKASLNRIFRALKSFDIIFE